MKPIALKPRVSEKSYGLSQASNTYVFDVPLSTNKITVAQAVTSQFKVTVEGVNILVNKGKAVKSYRKGRRPVAGRRNSTKRAFVTLKKGDTVPVFAAIEEANKASEKESK